MTNKHYTKILALCAIITTATGCSMVGETYVRDGGRFTLATDERGMQAFSDLLAGMQTNAKASADVPDTAYYQLRRNQNAGRYVVKAPAQQGGK